MPADSPPRRITIIKVPYNYEWPGRSAVSCIRETGEVLVKAEMADHAVANGYAIEGWSSLPATKGKTRRRTSARKKADAGTLTGPNTGMGRAGVAADDSAGARQPVATAAD